ncbi:MAG: glycosyl transferase [Lachnospiraceae bacterium]|nr:glycosyl transferase [Lachnospiraceae bacterium]
MNKHAYLIIAHNEPEILYRTLKLLDDERNHFYIHIDKKSQCYNNLDEGNLDLNKSKVYFSKRTDVAWGGDSLIKLEFLLLEQAFNSGEKYSFYHYLSGVDMPIKTKDVIYRFFEDRKKHIFLSFSSKTMDEKWLERVKYYYFFQNKIGRQENLFGILQNKVLGLQKRCNIDRSGNKVYQKGSNWCSLNAASAEYIVRNKKKLLNQFEYTLAGDEMFIHTAIFNSEYLNDVYMYKESNGFSARQIDWERGMPYVFREEDFDELMNSEAMFARKFSWEIDKNIVMRIYEKLMEYQSEK